MTNLAKLACTLAALTLPCVTISAQAAEISAPVRAVLDFDKNGKKLDKSYRVGYLIQCVNNPYCQASVHGMEDAAKKFGFQVKIFDANFTAAEQLRQTQDATAQKFDAYIFAPITAASGCTLWKQYLKPTGKPVVSLDLPMCGDLDYTPGLEATVILQRAAYEDAMPEYAFAHCGKASCGAAAIGGFVGSDLQNLWEAGLKKAEKAHPNVHLIVSQPGNYDPQVAMRVTQDALRAHPEIDIVVSQWDDMSRGIAQAVTFAGKKPGTDVKIFSSGGQKDALDKIRQGVYESTAVCMPYEEGYYAGVSMAMALQQGKGPRGFVNEEQLPRITDGPGTIFITKDNVDKFTPEY
jgi:galactofuranose transport system substrate-binding protein